MESKKSFKSLFHGNILSWNNSGKMQFISMLIGTHTFCIRSSLIHFWFGAANVEIKVHFSRPTRNKCMGQVCCQSHESKWRMLKSKNKSVSQRRPARVLFRARRRTAGRLRSQRSRWRLCLITSSACLATSTSTSTSTATRKCCSFPTDTPTITSTTSISW